MITHFFKRHPNPAHFNPERLFRLSRQFHSRGVIDADSIPRWLEIHGGPDPPQESFSFRDDLNAKISLWHGDMTLLKVDGIVNAANEALAAGGGICGAIHRAAGPGLAKECRSLGGCATGQTKITDGYRLPAKKVLHSVGPIGEYPDELSSCYRTVLDLATQNDLRSVCFCCISTGIFGYPNENATEVALRTVRNWLEVESNANQMDHIIFCAFAETDLTIYEHMLPIFFPRSFANSWFPWFPFDQYPSALASSPRLPLFLSSSLSLQKLEGIMIPISWKPGSASLCAL